MNGTVENLPISRFITPGWLSFTSTVHCSFWPLAFVYRRWCRNFRSSPKPFPVKTPLKLRSVAPDTKGKSFRKRQSAVNSHWLKITSKVSFYMIASKAKALCDLWWPRQPLIADRNYLCGLKWPRSHRKIFHFVADCWCQNSHYKGLTVEQWTF